MIEIIILQMPAFKRVCKRLHKNQKIKVDAAMRLIIQNPSIGDEKKGNLAGVYVYKFKIQKQEFLLAYAWNPKKRLLMVLGVHENFYRDLRR